jgi:hypothetical protein
MSAESGPSVSSAFVHPGQGDQIWGIFVPYNCCLYAFFENFKGGPYLLPSFSQKQLNINLDKNLSHWATLWATFSQNHLVTLIRGTKYFFFLRKCSESTSSSI